MSQTNENQSVFSLKTALIVVAIGVISFLSLIVLTAFAPDLESKDRAGLHAYSKSALGYNFAVKLLTETGYTVTISRDPNELTDEYGYGILVVTPKGRNESDALTKVPRDREDPILVVLPKRFGRASLQNPSHQRTTEHLDLFNVEETAHIFDRDIVVTRAEPPKEMTYLGQKYQTDITSPIQLIASPSLEPIISMDDKIVLGRIQGTAFYILSDPELMNTHGLSKLENAALLLKIFEYISQEDTDYYPVIFDTTIHGFSSQKNVLKTLFTPPLLGASLFAITTALLLGWGAFIRFGKIPDAPPVFNTGRATLIKSTAGLFKQTSREHLLARDYGSLTERLAASGLGYPDDLTPETLRNVLAQAEQTQVQKHQSLTERPDAKSVYTSGQLLNFAKAYHQWKKDISNERD